MRELTKALKTLSDETRLRILYLLVERECCVCEVVQALNISQARASRNLSALYDAGFLKLRHNGLWSFYSINEETNKVYCKEMIDTIRKALEGNKLVLQDTEQLKRIQRICMNCAVNN